jgi:SRSO17 transposase
VATGHSLDVDPARWQVALDELLGRVAGRFGRVEPRQRAKAFVCGLLADLPRKNCWTIAEHAGDASPDGMQHLLARAIWDEDAVRDDVGAYLVEHLGDPAAVLVIDETGDLKKGAHTVGCSASTPAPPAASRTPRSPSTSSTPAMPGTP